MIMHDLKFLYFDPSRPWPVEFTWPWPDMSTDTEKKAKNMPVDNPDSETVKEEERTLTDHLNKRLLESFLARMEAGTTGFPNLPQPQTKETELEGGHEDGGEFD